MLFIYSDSYLTYYERSGIYFEHSKRLPVAYQLRRKYSYSAEVGEMPMKIRNDSIICPANRYI
jgi:hypothetical protein